MNHGLYSDNSLDDDELRCIMMGVGPKPELISMHQVFLARQTMGRHRYHPVKSFGFLVFRAFLISLWSLCELSISVAH